MTQIQSGQFHDLLFPSSVRLTRDDLFKAVFADKNDLSVLKELLKASLPDIDIHSLTLLPTEIPPSGFRQKLPRFDIHVIVNDAFLVDVEMQHSAARDTLFPRLEYYAARMLACQQARGLAYSRLKGVRIVLILDNGSVLQYRNHLTDLNTGSIKNGIEESGEFLTSKIQMSIIELDKASALVNVPVSLMTPVQRWSFFLKYVTDAEHKTKIEELIELDEGCRKGVNKLMSLYDDYADFFRQEDIRRYEADIAIMELEQREREQALLIEGEEKGSLTKVAKLTLAKLRKGMASSAIAEDLIEERSLIEKIVRFHQLHPDSAPEEIATALLTA